MKIENNMTMKMKLIPEPSCLETQEKFWRGRFKEMSEKFAEERKKMEILLLQITAENERLKNELQELASNPLTCSVSVQASPIENETDVICKYCQRPLIKTRTIFSKNSGTSHKNVKKDEDRSEFFIDHDLVLRENTSFTEAHNRTNDKEGVIDVEKTITKLFSSNDHSNSQKITSKLLELYEKRSKSVPDLVYDEAEFEYGTSDQDENKLIAQDDRDHARNETLKTNEEIFSNVEINSILSESIDQYVKAPKHSKRKNRFLPSVQNIRKKVFKNISKIRRTCTNVKMNNDHLNLVKASSSNSLSSGVTNKPGDSISEFSVDTESNEENVAKLQSSSKRQLISAMKKSKSTGNIVKKVAFSDDLPSIKTVSESNLLQTTVYRKPQLVGSVQVHRDRFARPIPAPRSRKNIVMVDP